MPKKIYSEKEFNSVDMKYQAVLRILIDLSFSMEHVVREDKRKKPLSITSGKSYNFIPNGRMDDILNNLILARKKFQKVTPAYAREYKFLDAGCGIGNIVMLAKKLRFDAYGIDIDNSAMTRGRKLFPALKFKNVLLNRNIMTYNGYSGFDVIYYYCPFRDTELELAFEEYVDNNVKEGAIIIAYLKKGVEALKKDSRFKIWKSESYEGVVYQRLPNPALLEPTNGEASETFLEKELKTL